QRHRFSLLKDRRDYSEVVEVPGGQPGIVTNQAVAFLQGFPGVLPKKVAYRQCHSVDVTWGASHRLGDHVPLRIEHSRRQVASLTHHGSERSVLQSSCLLVDDRDQAIP